MPVLGTVAHFLPILSMMKPAGKIIVKTQKPDMVNKSPTAFGVSPSLELA